MVNFEYLFGDLRALTLNRNKLVDIPIGLIKYGKAVETIDMSSNSLSSIKNVTFLKNFCLTKLNFSSNNIEKIEPNSFYTLNLVTDLDFSQNLLTTLDDSTFHGLFSLTRLYLSSNLVQIIQDNLFEDLNNLIELELDQNPIIFIQDYSFTNLKYLKILRLDSFNSSVSRVTNSTFIGLNSIREIYINSKLLQNVADFFSFKNHLNLIVD